MIDTTHPPEPEAAPNPRTWHPAWKAFATLLLSYHLLSMVVASYCAGPASQLAYDIYRYCRCGHYAQATYVNHGYRFFSPEPGAGNLVEFQAVLKDGTRQTEMMPNRGPGGQWPRVYYHRHFMLTEYLAASSERPQELELTTVTYASQYLREHPEVAEVTLVWVVHTLPPPEFILAGGDLQNESNYLREPLGTFRWDDEQRIAVRVGSVDRGGEVPPPSPATSIEMVPPPEAASASPLDVPAA